MIKFESRDMIAVIGLSQQQNRTIGMLQTLAFSIAEFPTLDKLVECGEQPHAVVFVTDAIDSKLIADLQFVKHIENIVVISNTTVEGDVVAALYGGAHFVFDITEADSLLAVRLNAALRSYGAKTFTTIIAPPYKFDVERRQVYLDNKSIALSPKEYQFAEYIFSRPGITIPKSELMLSIWSLPRKSDARRVDTAACRVRKKMQLSSQSTGWELVNLRNMGFVLSPLSSG